jgi:hypothetical protein
MLTRDYGKVVFVCDTDGCDIEIKTECNSIELARAVAQAAGWMIEYQRNRIPPVWRNHCQFCVGYTPRDEQLDVVEFMERAS